MTQSKEIDILKVIEGQRLGGFQVALVALVFAVMLADGYDAQNIGFAAPVLTKAWAISKATFGPIFGAGLAGLLLGAAIFGPLGDRFGRKRMIVISALFLGVINLATMTSTSPELLLYFRFLAGLGVGGVLPNSIALISEYSPKRVQATAVWIIMTGYSAGAASGALVSTWLVPQFGWPVMFLVGGLVPIVIAALQILFLPESVRFLALRPGKARQSRDVARTHRPAALHRQRHASAAARGETQWAFAAAAVLPRPCGDDDPAMDRLCRQSDDAAFPVELDAVGARQHIDQRRAGGHCHLADPSRRYHRRPRYKSSARL